jgi:hypothetical protein
MPPSGPGAIKPGERRTPAATEADDPQAVLREDCVSAPVYVGIDDTRAFRGARRPTRGGAVGRRWPGGGGERACRRRDHRRPLPAQHDQQRAHEAGGQHQPGRAPGVPRHGPFTAQKSVHGPAADISTSLGTVHGESTATENVTLTSNSHSVHLHCDGSPSAAASDTNTQDPSARIFGSGHGLTDVAVDITVTAPTQFTLSGSFTKPGGGATGSSVAFVKLDAPTRVIAGLGDSAPNPVSASLEPGQYEVSGRRVHTATGINSPSADSSASRIASAGAPPVARRDPRQSRGAAREAARPAAQPACRNPDRSRSRAARPWRRSVPRAPARAPSSCRIPGQPASRRSHARIRAAAGGSARRARSEPRHRRSSRSRPPDTRNARGFPAVSPPEVPIAL